MEPDARVGAGEVDHQVGVGLAGADVVGHALRRASDLEREPVPGGGEVGPVLGGAGGVVELVALPVRVAVLRSHLGAELPVLLLVDDVAVRRDARRAEDQVRVGVVGDQCGHLAVGDQPLHVLGLGLRERPLAPEGVAGRVWARPGPAPEATVVSVRVDAIGAVRRLRAGARPRLVAAFARVELDHAAVAPLIGEAGVDHRLPGVDRPRPASGSRTSFANGTSRVRLKPSGLTTGTTIVRVRLTRSVVCWSKPYFLTSSMGPLDGMLARGPLPGVMKPHLKEHRLTVTRVRVPRDLDSLDGASLEAAVGQRDQADDAGASLGEPLHVGRVVRQAAVVRAPAGHRLPRAARAAAHPERSPVVPDEVRDHDPVAEGVRGKSLHVVGPVEHDVEVGRGPVLGEIEPGGEEAVLGGSGRGRDADQLDAVVPGRHRQRPARDAELDGLGRAPIDDTPGPSGAGPWSAIPSASSTLPKWAEPATVRPLASKTPRSESPPAAPLRRALITPVAGAVTWRWTYPAPPVK